MKRGHPEEALAVYVTGALDPRERMDVERHLGDCAACRATVADYRRLLEHLATAPAPEVAWPRYRAELRSRLDVRTPRWGWARWLRPVSLMATSAVVAAAAILVFALAPSTPPADLASMEYEGLAARMEMIDHYHVVEQLDLLEDLDVIRSLDQLTPTREG